MLTSDFMVKKVEAMRPEVQRITDELLDGMTEGRDSADLVAEFALPLPSLVICLLLGVPYEDHEFFQKRSRTLLSLRSTADDVRTAQADLQRYLIRLAESKRQTPDEGIVEAGWSPAESSATRKSPPWDGCCWSRAMRPPPT